jgi:hypothetical protein
MQDRKNKFVYVELAMTTSAKVRMSFLVSTMLTHQQKELNMIKINKCNYFRLTWKPTSHTMVTKVLQLHHEFLLSTHCHERNVRGGYP